jgi:hypothetical protein
MTTVMAAGWWAPRANDHYLSFRWGRHGSIHQHKKHKESKHPTSYTCVHQNLLVSKLVANLLRCLLEP